MISVGMYVRYNNVPFLVTEIKNNMIRIVNPDSKNFVGADKLEPMNLPNATKVTHDFRDYLVTNKDLIISLTTHRVMKWDDSNGVRKQILAKA